jgi:hypothetical protein
MNFINVRQCLQEYGHNNQLLSLGKISKPAALG